MDWLVNEWICDGYKATRPDGERVFIYHSIACPELLKRGLTRDAYEFRWRGKNAGWLGTEAGWRQKVKLYFTLTKRDFINEQDLLEIAQKIDSARAKKKERD